MGAVDRLCFGTSTFVSGRLRPGKDSAPGMAALRAAIDAGVRLVHSNPKLGTQWAVRRVLDGLPASCSLVRHLIKAEAPLGACPDLIVAKIVDAVEASRAALGIGWIHAVVLEIDIKRTARSELLDDAAEAGLFYRHGADAALAFGHVDQVYAYCHRPAHVAGALACADIAGVAAQYHRAQPWAGEHLGEITGVGRVFVGMSPLDRGRLVDPDASTSGSRLAALEWALADPRVSVVAITMSSVVHVAEVIHLLEAPSRSTTVDR